MDDPSDKELREALRVFLQRNARQAEAYQQAARYVAARRLMQDLAALREPPVPLWHRVHPARVVGAVRTWFHHSSKEKQPGDDTAAAVIIDGEVVSRRTGTAAGSHPAETNTPPIVIIIPPVGHDK